MTELPSLYQHQETQKDAARASLAKHRRSILTAPPGTGKTRMAKWILGSSANREPTDGQSGHSLFAVHRRGLVDNAVNSFEEEPSLPHGVIMSGRDTSYSNRIQVASVDSLLSWFVEDNHYRPKLTFDLVIFDECISGDAVIETDLGLMRLDDVPKRQPSLVKAWTKEKGVHFSRILRWTLKGHRDTIVVHTNSGKVRCTPDHEIYTRRGWLQAQFICPSDEILVCADAGVVREKDHFSHGDAKTLPAKRRLWSHGKNYTRMPRYVSVDAGHRSARRLFRWTSGFHRGCQLNTTDMRQTTKNVRLTRRWNLRLSNAKQYSALSLAIRRLSTHTATRNPLGCRVRIATSSLRGRSTRPTSCIALTPRRGLRAMMATVTCQFALLRPAIRASRRYMKSFVEKGRSEYHENGLMASATSASHGGFVTTVLSGRSQCSFTPRDTRSTKTRSLQDGCGTTSARPRLSTFAKRTSISSASPVGRRSKSASECHHTSPSACDTSWSRVTKIVHAKPTAVYDIEVESSHCFFANGLLVHNCHSHHQKLAKFLKYHDAKREEDGLHPAYVIGLTATPQAKGLADVYKEIVPGPPTQWLIDNKYLSPFRYFRATEGRLGLLVKRGGEFTKDSVCEAMDGLAGDLVRDWKRFAEGRPTVGFFPRRSHAKDAMAKLQEAGLRVEYVDGETPDEERLKIFRYLNGHYIDYLCNVQVVERGTDIPRIGCVQLCTAIGSLVRYRQMIGRGSRCHPEKTDCLASGTMILTHRGLVPIEKIRYSDRLWDGLSWVRHGGTICKGVRNVITYQGLTATPNHLVKTEEGWLAFGYCASQQIPIIQTGLGGTAIRERENHIARNRVARQDEVEAVPVCKGAMRHLFAGICRVLGQPYRRAHQGMPYLQSAEAVSEVVLRESSGTGEAMQQFQQSSLQGLRRSWHTFQLCIRGGCLHVDQRESWDSQAPSTGPCRERRALRGGQLALVHAGAESRAHSKDSAFSSDAQIQTVASGCPVRRFYTDPPNWHRPDIRSDQGSLSQLAVQQTQREVWDILNAGPLHRFTAQGLLVHNCIVIDHGGSIQRHGFFEDDPPWTLDITTKDPGEVGARPTIECPKCQALYRGGKCKQCGYEPTPRERRAQGLQFDGSELKEVQREEKKETAAKTAEELMISALYMAGRSGRTWRQCCGIFKGKCEKQGSNFRVPSTVTVGGHRYQMVRYGSDDSSRKVSALYPFVNGEHGGKYLIHQEEHSAAPY